MIRRRGGFWQLKMGISLLARTGNVVAGVSLITVVILLVQINNLENQLDHYDSIANPIRNYYSEKEIILKKFRHLKPSELNITNPDARQTLVFNRAPKVGSQGLMTIMKMLSIQNGFSYHKDRGGKSETIKLTEREQSRLVNLINLFNPPTVYIKHVCYIDFDKFNQSRPIYMNMVRDPVERIISWYYYVRAPWYYVERKIAYPFMKLPSATWLKKDFETCVKTRDPECDFSEGSVSPNFDQLTEFFCGQDDRCVGMNNEYAFTKAKENVDKHYAVVGVLEEMDMTLKVFENFLPRFFKNASQVYKDQFDELSKVNKNIYKPPVSEEIKEMVRKNLTREMEFYEFCKQRLYKQFASLNLEQ